MNDNFDEVIGIFSLSFLYLLLMLAVVGLIKCFF